MKRFNFLIALLVFASIESHAKRCIEENYILISSKYVAMEDCKSGKELKLLSMTRWYPLLKNTLTVKYWQGSYFRELTVAQHYLRLISNRCTREDILREDINTTYKDKMYFDLLNPNLDDRVDVSYKTLPLTDEEAVSALAQAKIDCEAFILPD